MQGFIPGRPIVEIDIEESGLPSLHTDIDDFVEAVRACSLSSAAVKKLRITSFRARASVNATVLINAIGACFPALLSSDLLVNDDHPDTDINSVMDDDNVMDVDNSNAGYLVSMRCNEACRRHII